MSLWANVLAYFPGPLQLPLGYQGIGGTDGEDFARAERHTGDEQRNSLSISFRETSSLSSGADRRGDSDATRTNHAAQAVDDEAALEGEERELVLTSYQQGDGPQSRVSKNAYGTESVGVAKQGSSMQWILDLYAVSNVGILVSYFSIGVVSRVVTTPVSYYLIEGLDASSTQYSVYSTLHRLPWSLKFIFGMLSDGISILGYRRKPWLLIGWGGFMLINMYLVSIGTPGIDQTILLVFALTCFLVQADVCTDTLTVERSYFESAVKRGSIQSTGFIFRSFGRVLGAVLGTFLYENGTSWSFDISQIFLLEALVPLISMLPVFWPLLELASPTGVPSFSEQMAEVWRVLQLRAVWRPMLFICTFSMLQIPNSSWNNFLVVGLSFSDAQLGYLTITSAIVGCVGYLSFKIFFFYSSWRRIYIGTGFVSFCFSIMQCMLILRVNKALGIPDIFFAVGDEAVVSLMESLHGMPSVIMFVMLCPKGAEGTSFALLTTIASLAGTVAADLGTWLTNLVDVSNETLASGDFTGVLKLTILTSVLQLSPLLLIDMLPDTREEHQAAVDASRHSRWGGFFLAAFVILALVVTVGVNGVLLF